MEWGAAGAMRDTNVVTQEIGAAAPTAVEHVDGSKTKRFVVRWLPCIIAGFFFLVYLTLALARWNRMSSPSWDLAIFEQGIKGYANFGAPIVDIKGPGYNQLGDHFSPLIAIIAPLYKIFPSAVTLLVSQCVLISVSIVPVVTTARKRLGVGAAAWIGIAYGASWGIQSALDVEFHEYSLGVPIVAFGLAAFLNKRWVASAIWISLLLLVKEDLGLTVAAFGVLLWFKDQRRLGAIVAAVGVAGMALILFVLIPAVSPTGQYEYWGKLEEDPAAAKGLIEMVGSFFTPMVKYETVFLLLLITGFVALRSWITLLIVPTLVWRFAGSTEAYWGTSWHYSVILMPILFMATIDGLTRLKVSPRAWLRTYARVAPLIIGVIAILTCYWFPFRELFVGSTYQGSGRADAAYRVLDMVPDGSSVATDTGLISRLPSRTTTYWITDGPKDGPEYVLIDQWVGWGSNPPKNVAEYAESVYPGADYMQVFNEDGYLLAKKNN